MGWARGAATSSTGTGVSHAGGRRPSGDQILLPPGFHLRAVFLLMLLPGQKLAYRQAKSRATDTEDWLRLEPDGAALNLCVWRSPR